MVISSKQIEQLKEQFIIDNVRNSIAFGRNTIMSAIFGTGIAAAESNQVSQKTFKNSGNSDFKVSQAYTPDANPDGLGGFTPTVGWDGSMSSSLSGMPVMCKIKFVGTSYLELDGTTTTIPDIIFETVIITMKQGKEIEKTKISGRKKYGTVKEYISDGDWNIEIRAIITDSTEVVTGESSGRNQDGSYPMSNMESIMTLLNAPIALKVECWYLNKIAGINYLVVEDGVDISQVEGGYEMQRITIPCLSDNPLIITIAE